MSRIRLMVVALTIPLALIAVGCGDRGSDPEESPIDVPEADLKALAEGNNQFAVELYKKLAAEHDGNIVVSPYSISSALAMTYAGARGETAEQMKETLHFTLPPDRLHPAFGGLSRRFQGKESKAADRLTVANALWVRHGLKINPEYRTLLKDCYSSRVSGADFARAPDAARQAINRWASDETGGLIRELIGPDDLDSDTQLVLTNAVYFYGAWQSPFAPAQTADAPFASPEGTVTVPTLRGRGQFDYAETSTFRLLALPYRDETKSLVLLLPTTPGELGRVERSLTAESLGKAFDGFKPHHVRVEVPRLKTRQKHRLRRELESLGLSDAFTGRADFGGITSEEQLRLDEVVHQAAVEWDESGTTAAAATAVIAPATSSRPTTRSTTFRADRPFLFLIVHHQPRSVVFMGRVTDPRP